MMVEISVWLVCGYLSGSIAFGLLVGYVWGLGDIRLQGSGNIGVTNVLRVGGRLAALVALVGDSGKGLFIVYAARIFAEGLGDFWYCAIGFAAIGGHIFPVWLRFCGGKGVAVAFGALIAVNFLAALIVMGVWLVLFGLSRISSLAALGAFSVLPVIIYGVYGEWEITILALLMSLLIIWRHRDNIKRLWAGSEQPISFKIKG